jgi:hypothetical protein
MFLVSRKNETKRRLEMRKCMIASCILVLLFAGAAQAQLRTGRIYGKIVDTEGKALPGVTLTLTGSFTAPLTFVTTGTGLYRFVSLPPAKDYALRAELPGFQTEITEDIMVSVDASVELNITMKMGIKEEITVIAEAPLIDRKTTSLGLTATQEILNEIPTSRDPWTVLQTAPAIQVNKENIGGSTSGDSSSFFARGGTDFVQSMYSIDGVVISNPTGGTPSYFDFDSINEMNIVVGGADVRIQTPGVSLNLVTKRGGNKVSFESRFYVTEQTFQADNLTSGLRAEGVKGTNRILEDKDYGFNFGLPIIRDKVWFWMGYGVQDFKTQTIFGTPNNGLLTNYTCKFNAQIVPRNRFEVFFSAGNKEKQGRSTKTSLPQGYLQHMQAHFGIPILKIQDEHQFGDNLLINLVYGHSNPGWYMVPMIDQSFTNLPVFDVTNQLWSGSEMKTSDDDPWYKSQVNVNYFNDKLFGLSHDIKLGFEYCTRKMYYDILYSGNVIVRQNYNTLTVDANADGMPDLYPDISQINVQRGNYSRYGAYDISGYFSDTLSFGRFTLMLGVRYDKSVPRLLANDIKAVDPSTLAWTKNFAPNAMGAIDSIIPGINIPEIKATAADGSDYYWSALQPRFGLTWDLSGDGRTIAKVSIGRFQDYMSTMEADRWKPQGTGGWMNFWWLDSNKNSIVDLSELYWSTTSTYALYRAFDDSGNFLGDIADGAGVMYGDYDPLNPKKTIEPYQIIDKNAGSTKTWELVLSLEREIFSNFVVSGNLTFRRYDNYRRALQYYPDTNQIESQDWYMSAGNAPANAGGVDTEDAKNQDWHVLKAGYQYTPYSWVKLNPDLYRDFIGFDLLFTKRLANKWMLNAAFSWQDEHTKFGSTGLLNKTNAWAFEGEPDSTTRIFSHWLVKVAALYQLPYDITLALNFNARQGNILRETITIVDYGLPNPRSNSAMLYLTPFDSLRLANVYNLGLHVEKAFKLGGTSRVYLSMDVFNLLNSSPVISRNDRDLGTYYVTSGLFSPNAASGLASEILNPRVVRFGAKFQF